MKKCSIIIPVLNEASIIESAIDKLSNLVSLENYEVLFVESGSRDQTFELLTNYILKKNKNWRVLQEDLKAPSIAKAVSLGLENIQTEYAMILPIDCDLNIEALSKLQSILTRGLNWGGFEKKYLTRGLLKSAYAYAQNKVRTRVGSNLVWTNVFFGRTSVLKKHLSIEGFLEDIILSDGLKKVSDPYLLSEPVIVSDRKYDGRVVKRILINLSILVLYRLKACSIERLKHLYQ